MTSLGILAQAFLREIFKATTLLWDFAQALCSRMDQRLKSIGFKSGLDGGHIPLDQK